MHNGNRIIRFLYETAGKWARVMWSWSVGFAIKKSFACCGSNVRVSRGSRFSGIGNVSVGNHVTLGENLRVMSTNAKLKVGNYVMFGPGVTLITGDHRIDLLGKYMTQVTERDKLPENDQDIIIEDDVWIGANATILKGVRIGTGSVVAAGALVTKSFPPYSIIGGVPAKQIKERFTPEEIDKHKEMLKGIV